MAMGVSERGTLREGTCPGRYWIEVQIDDAWVDAGRARLNLRSEKTQYPDDAEREIELLCRPRKQGGSREELGPTLVRLRCDVPALLRNEDGGLGRFSEDYVAGKQSEGMEQPTCSSCGLLLPWPHSLRTKHVGQCPESEDELQDLLDHANMTGGFSYLNSDGEPLEDGVEPIGVFDDDMDGDFAGDEDEDWDAGDGDDNNSEEDDEDPYDLSEGAEEREELLRPE